MTGFADENEDIPETNSTETVMLRKLFVIEQLADILRRALDSNRT